MVGVGRDLWRSSSATTLLKQVHLEQVAQGRIQTDHLKDFSKQIQNQLYLLNFY